jgi:hypothetical protein
LSIFTKHVLSGSTNGRPIQISATATLGNTIHTASSGANVIDEIWLFAYNVSSNDALLTLEKGGVTTPDLLKINIPAQVGPVDIMRGILQSGLILTAFASVTNVISIDGWVNRIDQS